MENYNEQQISGKKWQRVARVIIDTPVKGRPTLMIMEETAVEFAGETRTTPTGQINVQFDPGKTFPLRHPITDELIGSSSSHEALQTLVYSLIRDEQLSRDKARQDQTSVSGLDETPDDLI